MPNQLPSRLTRRTFVTRASALTAATLAAPSLVRSQPRELVVGAASSQKTWSDEIMIPAFEKKYNIKVVFEGTRSLVNLEKLQKNKGQQYLSLVQMDDPVMILAVKEGLLDPMTTAKVPNMASLKPGTVHMDGMWVNYLQPWVGIAYNKAKMPVAPTSWTEAFDPKYKGRVVLPSLQNTEGVLNLFVAAQLKTGKPMAEAQKDMDAAFAKMKEMKANVLMAYTQEGQAYNLLEQGEAYMVQGAISSVALARKSKGAPIELAAPKEGTFSMPSGVCLVKGGPMPEMAAAYIDMLLSPEIQSKLTQATFSLSTNSKVAAPAGLNNLIIHPVDWAAVSQNRAAWVARWDRELSM
ncbi:MAG: ABC transporter substrate-binding protein [Polaromonas sp.]|nr:ABC transporter substrate-binding protein [Polaromonas sp.]